MIYVDNLLLQVINQTSPTVEEIVPARDAKLLRSLATAITGPSFITENQANLLIKVLDEHSAKLATFGQELPLALTAPIWSKPFRKLDQVKKLYLAPSSVTGETVLNIEFTFNAQLRKILANRGKDIENLSQVNAGKSFTADYTEKNIVALVELLAPYNFEVDLLIKQHYDTIKSWSKVDFTNQFLLTTIQHPNFQKQITADLGMTTPIDENIIHDRSMRYQFFTENPKNPENSLISQIANRPTPRVWIDSNEHTLSDVIKTLIDLKRLPLMIVFDHKDNEDTEKTMEKLHLALVENNVTDHVGIYFRLPSAKGGIDFNRCIAENNYNAQLDHTTEIVGVTTGKIPKFFLSNNWKPMSVISINSHLRSSKTAVYASCCDLIISYTHSKPIIEKYNIWQ